MCDNIFESLGRYRDYSQGRRTKREFEFKSEEENYFSESFKVLLQNDKEFTKKILEYFLRKKSDDTSKKLDSDIKSIKAQELISDKRPDIEITLESGKKFVIENKLRTQQGENQLSDYLERADFVIFITLYYEAIDAKIEKDEKFLGHFYWYEVYDLIKKYYTNPINQWLFNQFTKFMEGKHMESLKLGDLNQDDFKKFLKIYNQIRNLSLQTFNFLKERTSYEIKEENFVDDRKIDIEVEDGFLIFGSIDIDGNLFYNFGIDTNPKKYVAYTCLGYFSNKKKMSEKFCTIVETSKFKKIMKINTTFILDNKNEVIYIESPLSDNLPLEFYRAIEKFKKSGLIKLFK